MNVSGKLGVEKQAYRGEMSGGGATTVLVFPFLYI